MFWNQNCTFVQMVLMCHRLSDPKKFVSICKPVVEQWLLGLKMSSMQSSQDSSPVMALTLFFLFFYI